MIMKTMTYLNGILLALSVTTAAAQDKKIEPPAAGQDANLITSKDGFSSAQSGAKATDLILPGKSSGKIVRKRFVFSGPLVALAKSKNRLQTFNPFSAANNRAAPDDLPLDPYLPPPRGITLFRVGF